MSYAPAAPPVCKREKDLTNGGGGKKLLGKLTRNGFSPTRLDGEKMMSASRTQMAARLILPPTQPLLLLACSLDMGTGPD